MNWDSLGGRIKRARLKAKVKQKGLAKALGKTQAAISAYETNKNIPPFRVVAEIAAVLGVTPYALLGTPPAVPGLGAAPLITVSFVPVLKVLSPEGPSREPGNISTYAPFPSHEGEDVIGYALTNATGTYQPKDILFLSPQETYQPQSQVLYLEGERVVVQSYSEVPPALRSLVVGAIVGFYRAAE